MAASRRLVRHWCRIAGARTCMQSTYTQTRTRTHTHMHTHTHKHTHKHTHTHISACVRSAARVLVLREAEHCFYCDWWQVPLFVEGRCSARTPSPCDTQYGENTDIIMVYRKHFEISCATDHAATCTHARRPKAARARRARPSPGAHPCCTPHDTGPPGKAHVFEL